MFSRLARRSFDVHKSLIFKHQPAIALNTEVAQKMLQEVNSSQRDLVNFPRLVRAEYPPPVRHLFIPEAWFQNMYPKTGVTGPYALFFTVSTFLFSKEYFVLGAVPHLFTVCLLIGVAHYKFGDKVAELHNNYLKKIEDRYNEAQIKEQEAVENKIVQLKNSVFDSNLISEFAKAKKENILLQMESIYRERLAEVYKKVKKQLDFQVELENVERQILQKNLSDYVIRKVSSSITPEIEKNVMQMCITNLNSLASKQ